MFCAQVFREQKCSRNSWARSQNEFFQLLTKRVLTKRVFFCCSRNECSRNEFFLSAHETSAHETSFFGCSRNECSRNEFFFAAHETSAHETSFWCLLTKRVVTKRVLTRERRRLEIFLYKSDSFIIRSIVPWTKYIKFLKSFLRAQIEITVYVRMCTHVHVYVRPHILVPNDSFGARNTTNWSKCWIRLRFGLLICLFFLTIANQFMRTWKYLNLPTSHPTPIITTIVLTAILLLLRSWFRFLLTRIPLPLNCYNCLT